MYAYFAGIDFALAAVNLWEYATWREPANLLMAPVCVAAGGICLWLGHSKYASRWR